jgi:peptidoglycan/LPS O-acetylase OafA/YrhL
MSKVRIMGASWNKAGMPQPGNCQPLSGFFSTVLDLIRLVAAMGVFVSHLCRPEYSSALGAFQPVVGDGHEWVVLFLVISGFVVSHSTLSRPTSAAQYAIKRLARLWSVLLPALLVTVLADLLLRLSEGLPDGGWSGSLLCWARSGLTAMFLNEIWFLSSAPEWNKPLWSISYEFWYYALFAAAVFPRTAAAKAGCCIAVLAVAGPKIALLFPCWWAGWVLWRRTSRVTPVSHLFKRQILVIVGCALLFCVAWVIGSGWRITLIPEAENLWFSRWFLSDWIVAATLAAALFMLHAGLAPKAPATLNRSSQLLRRAADQTFAVYALHYPLLAGMSVLLGDGSSKMLPSLLGGAAVLALCLAGGLLTRAFHRRLLSWAA